MVFITAILTYLALVEGSAGAASPVLQHPLQPATWCPALGPQAVLERLAAFVSRINREQQGKYLAILKYLKDVPELMEPYLWGQDIEGQHAVVLEEFARAVRQRFQLIRQDVLTPWRQLAALHQLSLAPGQLQRPAQLALADNLAARAQCIGNDRREYYEYIVGLVEQYRLMFINYKAILQSWADRVWPPNGLENNKKAILEICFEEFPAMLGKPLFYLIDDEELEFHHDHPSGYEPVFGVLGRLRTSAERFSSASDDSARWNHLLQLIPPGGSNEGEREPTDAEKEMEEEFLSTHIVNMMTAYPVNMTELRDTT